MTYNQKITLTFDPTDPPRQIVVEVRYAADRSADEMNQAYRDDNLDGDDLADRVIADAEVRIIEGDETTTCTGAEFEAGSMADVLGDLDPTDIIFADLVPSPAGAGLEATQKREN